MCRHAESMDLEGDCFDCEDAAHLARHPGLDDPECVSCRLASVQLSPKCYPSSRNHNPPSGNRDGNANAWERGIATDHRGLPYRDSNLNPIGLKQFTAKRSVYEESIRRNVAKRDGQPASV